MSERLRHSVLSHIPALRAAADYFFRRGIEGKRLRPTLALLMGSALSDAPPGAEHLVADLSPPAQPPAGARRRQQRIAEIAELIHVASLLHDDVLDDAATRRGIASLNARSGDKLAILAGDFLLARASVSLAALEDTRIVALLSAVLEHLVAGEIMQMSAAPEDLTSMEHYLAKTFNKTASLMAHSAQAVALLAGGGPEAAQHAWAYGRHVGLAFQIVDDVLDLTGSASALGKPALSDLRSGIATAPVLFAAAERPELLPLIRRRFKQEGDVAAAMEAVAASAGIARARELAATHAAAAAEAIGRLPPARSQHAEISREALIKITERVLHRSK